MKEKPQLLSERLIKKNGCCEVYEQYYKGHHPRGVDVIGWTGEESRVIKQVIKPPHVFQVFSKDQR